MSSFIHLKMSSCLTGSGRAYGLDLEMLVKSPSLSSTTSTITSHSSSSPTLSESGGNSPFTISTRKPRTPRKRPNQTYNDAAALLSTAYPKIFSPNNLALTKPCKFTKPKSIEPFFLGNSNSGSSPELLIPLRVVVDKPGFLLHVQPPIVSEKPRFDQRTRLSTVVVSDSRDQMCRRSPVEVDSPENFETESMLDGEIEEGIDSIMGGNANYENYSPNYTLNLCNNNNGVNVSGFCYGYPIGWGMERSESHNHEWRFVGAALRHADEGDWWRYPRVDVPTPQLYKTQTEKSKKKAKKKKKKKKLLENIIADVKPPSVPTGGGVQQHSIQQDEKPTNVVKPIEGLMLKLNHDNLLAAWSDRGSPFSEDPPANEAAGENSLHAKLAQIDLLSGEREASVLRYKEKRRTRLFSKKIRYQVRKVNADQRPRMKGRFVRRPEDSPFS